MRNTTLTTLAVAGLLTTAATVRADVIAWQGANMQSLADMLTGTFGARVNDVWQLHADQPVPNGGQNNHPFHPWVTYNDSEGGWGWRTYTEAAWNEFNFRDIDASNPSYRASAWSDVNQGTVSFAGAPDHDVWDSGVVPGPGDTALFNYGSSSSVFGDVNVVAGAFNPDHIILNAGGGNGNPIRPVQSRFNVLHDLSIQTLTITSGNTSSGQGEGLFYIGDGATLTLTGENPLTFGGNRANWSTIDIAPGGTLQFAGDNQTLDSFGNNVINPIQGGSTSRVVEFTNPNATITLGDPGMSTAPNIHLNEQTFRVHHEQTWLNPTGTGFISQRIDIDQAVIESIEGDRLDNLGQVNLRLERSTGNHVNTATLPGGTYGSLFLVGGSSSNRRAYVNMDDEIFLAGSTVEPPSGETPTQPSAFGLDIRGGAGGGFSQWRLLTNGHDLTIANGVRLRDEANANRNGAQAQVRANGSVVTIGGDLVYSSTTFASNTASPTNRIGIVGNDATIVNLAGSFNSNVRSPGFGGLHLSTMNLVGNGPLQTYEVGDAASATGVQTNTYSLGTMNIGNGAEIALVMLVNDNLNDNPVSLDGNDDPDEQPTDRDGEKLIVGTLNINAGSTLIANLGVASVEVGPNTLHIDPTATLDLFTDMPLGLGDIIPNFIGLGDQTSTWAALSEFVIDSTNSGYEFAPTLNNDQNTVWQVTAIPEPASLALVGLGGLMLLGRRR